jgi:carbon-monoxide dehydrogenase medium subunit
VSSPPLFFPRSIDEAVEVLADYDGTAKVVAGSTALTLLMNQKLVAPQALVSLSRLPDLAAIASDDEHLRLGALVTHADAARSPLVRAHASVVAQAFATVGNARIREAATVGGVMAEADYASDPPASIVLLDGWVSVQGPTGARRIPADELFVGFYETSLDEAEVITEIAVPRVDPGAGTVYLKYSSRSGEDRPCVGVAALVQQDGEGRCLDVRVSVGAAAERPLRLREVETHAVGADLDDALIERIADAYAEALDPVSDVRGSAWYRTEMTRVWVARALRTAADRCAPDVSAQGEQE